MTLLQTLGGSATADGEDGHEARTGRPRSSPPPSTSSCARAPPRSPCAASPPSSTSARRRSTGTSAAATSWSPRSSGCQSERLAERAVDGRDARSRVLVRGPQHLRRRDRAPGHHVAGPPDRHHVAARSTTSRRRSSPSSRPPASSSDALGEALRSILVVVTGALVARPSATTARLARATATDALWAGRDLEAARPLQHPARGRRPPRARREEAPMTDATDEPARARSPAGRSSSSPTRPTRRRSRRCCRPASSRSSPTVTVGFYCVPVLGEPELGVSVKVAGGVAGRRRPVQPRPRHRPGGRRPHQRRDQRPAQVPLRPRLLPPRRRRSPPGPATRATRSSSSPARSPATVAAPGRRLHRARVVDEVLPGHRRRRGRVRLPAARRRRRHHLRAAPRRGRRRRPRCCATARGIRSPATCPIVRAGPAQLVTHQPKARVITNAGPLDPDAFWPHADVIGGSRWPGHRGGPAATATREAPDGRHHRPLRRRLRRLPRRRQRRSATSRSWRRRYHDDFDRWAAEFENPYADNTGRRRRPQLELRAAAARRWRPTASSPR